MLPKRQKRNTIYESQWVNLYTDRVLMPSGKIIEKYHQIEFQKDGVVIILTDDKERVCFIKSLRYTTNRVEWELPAGSVEKGEDILATAEREVVEETGFTPRALKKIYEYIPSIGISNLLVHVVTAKLSDKPQTQFDTDEVKSTHWLSINEIEDLIESNELLCGVSLTAVLLYLVSQKPSHNTA